MCGWIGNKGGRLAVFCGLTCMLWGLHAPPAEARGAWRVDFSLGADYRRAHLDWSIAGTLAGTGPNILSELTWYNLEIAQVIGAAQVTVRDRLVLLGRGSYGVVANGKTRDSDYGGDNRTLEFMRSNSKGGGEVGDGAFAIGYHFHLSLPAAGYPVQITPVIGYSRYLQYLTIRDGIQTIPPTGAIADLHSSYHAEWSGPWLGVTMQVETDRRSSVSVGVEYHYADFYAKGDWNLRADLAHPVSFKHSSHGAGLIVSMALSHAVTAQWDVRARMGFQRWQSDPGIDTLNTITASGVLQPTVTRLNRVNWRSVSAGLAATYHF
jgi:hypothetical protein